MRLTETQKQTIKREVAEWLAFRQLCNQMIHEYIEESAVLASALGAGYRFVGPLMALSKTLAPEANRRQ